MTNAKKPAAKIVIKMLCVLSGDGEQWNPGDTLSVEADEAERLIALGAAVKVIG